jgi:hypothetical protein
MIVTLQSQLCKKISTPRVAYRVRFEIKTIFIYSYDNAGVVVLNEEVLGLAPGESGGWMEGTRVTGRVCEKIAQKVAQPLFCKNLYVTMYYRGKSFCANFCY